MKRRVHVTMASAMLVALGGTAPSAVAAHAAAATSSGGIRVLAGTTVIRGNHTTRIHVRFPKTATLAYDSAYSYSSAITVTGAGRFVGVMLMRDTTTSGTYRQWFAQLRVTGCGTPNCMPGTSSPRDITDGQLIAAATGFPETMNVAEVHHLTFPAGDYALTLVADTAPVTVTITFGGLHGTTTLAPRLYAPATTQSVNATLQPTPQAATSMVAGGQASIGSPYGVLAFAMSWRYTVRLADSSGWCFYSGGRTPPSGQYLPACPGDDSGASVPSFLILQQGVNLPSGEYGIAFVVGGQTWGQAVWSSGVSLIQSTKPASFLWLATDPTQI